MGGERPASKTAVVDEEREGAGITIEVLEQHFHQPLVTVAEELGVSLTMIKRLCRKLGMPRWPYRQIDSINKAMEDLHDQLQSARTEADRARYAKQLDAALKKKRLITRGAAAGVDPNVRNALYLADTADVSEEDIFGNPELMPKLSAALKTITKRKRVKGKPLVDLIATVQRDGSLPACVQVGSNGMSSSASSVATNNTVPPPTSTQGGIGNINRGRGPSVTSAGGRRLHRPPALDDALATSNEEYAANIGQAYGIVHHPGSSASATSISTSVSPVLTSIDTSSSAEDYFRHDWGHNNSGSSVGYGLQQYGGSSTRSAPPSVRGFTGGTLGSGGIGMDSPASSCTTLVAGASPVEGSISGGFSPSTKDELSPATSGAHATSAHLQRIGAEAAAMGRSVSSMRSTNATGARMQMPSSAPSIGGGHHWGHRPLNAGGGHLRTQHKRVSVTSSVASTDVDSLDTSHLLEFDDDDDDEGLDGSQLYGPGEMGNVDCYGGPSTAGGGAGGGGQGVSPEELRELEDALLMDNFVMGEELLTDMSTLAEAKGHQSFPDFRNVRASLPPLPRTDHTTGGQRGTPRSLSSGGNGSQHVPAVIGVSSSNAGSASPVNGATSNLAGNNTGHPRHGQRSMGRARSEVPPRPYTPGKATRGVSLPWPSQGLGGGGVSPRVGSSPRPPTPGTPVGTRMAPSPNGRRRGGEEAFPENFALPSANDLPPNGVGGPSPKSRRVGVRTFSERFPGSPQAGMVSPRMGFPHVSPRNSGAAGNFNVGACSPLDGGSDRTYFPGPASNTAVTAGFATGSPAHQSRSHRRSSSSNWGSGSGPAPRHGGMGDGGIDSSSAENSSINAGFEMTGNSPNWPGRLGESIKTNNSEASLCGRQSWGASSSGDTQSPQLNLSPRTAVSVAGGGPRPAFKSSTSHGHGVVCRRHSSPLPSFQTASGSIDSTGENAAAMGHMKTEFTKSEYVHDGGDMNDGHVNEVVGNGGGTTSVGMGGVLAAPAWAPPSPMLEASSLWSVMEGQHERHESMRAMSEASAAAVAAVAAAAVPSSGALTTSSSTLDDLSTRVMTTSMTMDL